MIEENKMGDLQKNKKRAGTQGTDFLKKPN